MTFQPVVPFGGNVGWAFLQRTREVQEAAFVKSPVIERDTTYFREKIGGITSPEDLVADRRLLTVALGAFGLDDDLPNRFFIRKVLEEGSNARDAFANRLADKRYLQLAEAFGFDLSPPNTTLSSFPDKIVAAFETRQFEIAVGRQNDTMRLAMGLGRELQTIAARDISENGLWFTIMGTPPLRAVFETALNLPSTIGSLDIDRQLEVFKAAAGRIFGDTSVRQFNDPARQQDLTRRYFVGSDLAGPTTATSGGSVALSILQSSRPFF